MSILGLIDPNAADNRNVPAIVPVNFWTDHEPIDAKGTLRPVDYVEYAKKGANGQTTVDKVERIKKHNPVVWSVIERSYDNWKKGQEDPVDGTPLDAWPAVTKGQVAQLRLLNIRSVEDVSNMTDGDGERFGMGFRALRDKARAFVQAKAGEAVVAEAMAEKDAKIAAMEQQMVELQAAVASLTKGKTEAQKPGDVAGRKGN